MSRKRKQKRSQHKSQRGDLYYVNLDPVVGSEQGGSRPVLVVQNNFGNHFSPTLVAAITSQRKPGLLTHVPLTAGESGPEVDSCVLLEQLHTLDRMRFSTMEKYCQFFGITLHKENAVPAGKRAWLYGRIAGADVAPVWVMGHQHGITSRCAEQMGFYAVGISDDRADGLSMERPGLAEIRQAAKESRFDVLFVANSSRLGRNTLRAAELLLELKEQGIKVYSVKEKLWLTEEPLLNMVMDAQWTSLEPGPELNASKADGMESEQAM